MSRIKFTLLLIICISASTLTIGQTKESSVTELLLLKSFPKDISATAIVIYDIGESDFNDTDKGFYSVFKRKCRIKVLKEAGLNYAEIRVPLFTDGFDCELFSDFKATAYNLQDGVIVSTVTENKDILKEEINKNWVQNKVAISGVKVGSVFDFEYTITSQYLFNLQDWEFQLEIPVLYSEYSAKMIPFYQYTYIIIGTNKLDELSSKEESGMPQTIAGVSFKKNVYKFVKENIPAFNDDSFISSPSDYKMKLDFQLSTIIHLGGNKEDIMSTWPEVNYKLLKHNDFGKYMQTSQKIAKKILEENSFSVSNKSKYAEELVDYVKTLFDWDGYYGIFTRKNAGIFLKEKRGNAGEINLFLIALLTEAGFTADPVILSTRDHGKVYSKYPFLHFFNYIIAKVNVDGKDFLADATEKLTYFDQIPERCINEIGLIVRKNEENWVDLTSTVTAVENNSFQFNFNENKDSVKCMNSFLATSYNAINEKTKYHNDTVKYVDEILNTQFDSPLSSKVFTSDSVKSFRYNVVGMIKPTRIDQYVSIQPFLSKSISENPLKKRERSYPVDFTYARKKIYISQIILPEGAKLVKQPENFKIDNSNYSLNYNVSVSNGNILISAEYTLKKPVYEASLYPGLKYFFENVIKYLNQPIEIQL